MVHQKRTSHGIKIPTKSIVTVVQSSKGHRKTTHIRLDKRPRAPAGGAVPQVEVSIEPLPEIDFVDSEDSPIPVPKPKKSNVSPNIHAPFH
jgi:hypothetical protein